MDRGVYMFEKQVVIIGNNDFANLMFYYLTEHDKNKVVAFSVDSEYIKEEIFNGIPVIKFETIEYDYPPNRYDVLIAIGALNMNDVRKKKFLQCKSKGYNIASYVHSTSIISADVVIGEGNIILEKCLIQPFVKIGDGNLFWNDTSIVHNDEIGNYNTISVGVSLSGFVKIKENCYIGNSAMIHEKIIIDDYTLIGAGAYVKSNTDKHSVIVPSKSIVLKNKKSTDFM